MTLREGDKVAGIAAFRTGLAKRDAEEENGAPPTRVAPAPRAKVAPKVTSKTASKVAPKAASKVKAKPAAKVKAKAKPTKRR
jgi:hypothetical protein